MGFLLSCKVYAGFEGLVGSFRVATRTALGVVILTAVTLLVIFSVMFLLCRIIIQDALEDFGACIAMM